MVSGDRMAAEASTVTLSIPGEALGALDAYLRSGGARGQPFEQALLQALGTRDAAPHRPLPGAMHARCALSQRTLRKVHEFITANLADDISVADIARAASLSPFHLGRSYHQATGQTLWQHVLQSRATLARRLMAERPHTTLGDIAVLSGFQTYSQFIAAFRKTHGMTPSACRRTLDADRP